MGNAIYALKGNSDWCDILKSLKSGEGRFGWSYVETADLRKLKERIDRGEWETLSDDEKECYQNFLLDLKVGDYVVYINIPEWGKCTIAQLTDEYQWRFEDKDFNHRFSVNPDSVYVFDRNDALVHPALSARLKLQRRWWRIYLEDEFMSLFAALQSGSKSGTRTMQDNLQFLSKALEPHLQEITRKIQHTHPNYDLECLFERVFNKVPGVINVKRQGGAGDHGADIIVTYDGGIPIPGLERQSVMVVQIKSHVGTEWDTTAISDIERAFEHYPEADMGLIILTADIAAVSFEKALDELREKSKKPVGLLIGPSVASFLLRYGANLCNC